MDWLHQLAEEAWDRQFQEDVLAGKLDFLKAEVEQAKQKGTLRGLPGETPSCSKIVPGIRPCGRVASLLAPDSNGAGHDAS